ncbi:hypothetical protein [Deinococcus sp.]|uniref:hypothetical protein n=1 Tax=Deinococcus sp. TaxID=47478 RepID=UPI003CC60D61
MSRRWLAFILIAFLMACSQAPSSSDVPADPSADTAVIIPATTKVADADTRAALTAYDSDSGVLRFSRRTGSLASLKPGDVLVSEPSDAAPSGYLRKVTAIRQDGTDTVLDTTQANLTDAISQGDLTTDFQLTGDDLLSTQGLPKGVTLTVHPAASGQIRPQVGTGENYGFTLNFDHTFVPVKGPNATGTVRVNGGVNFNVGYGVDVGIKPCFELPPICVKSFRAQVGFAQSSNLNVTGDFQGAVGDSVLVGTQYFKPKVFFIGPVPVVLVPKVELYLTASGEIKAHVNFAANEAITAQVGARWTKDGGWKDISGFDITGNLPPPTFSGSLNPRVGVQSVAGFKLYDVAGPEATLEGGAKLDVAYPRNPNWIVSGFMKGTLGFRVKLPILGTLASYSTTLFDISKELGRSSNTPPVLALTNQPHSATAGKPVNFRALCTANGPGFGNFEFYTVSDAEDGCPQITVTSNVDGTLSPDYTFQSPGNRTVTVTARDSGGATAQLSFVLNVVNPPPPVLYVKSLGDPHPGEAFLMSAAIVTPDNADLCGFTNWAVDAPDKLSTSGGCDVNVTFGTTGARHVTVSTHDRQGTVASQTVTLNVLPTPANPYPIIKTTGVYRRGGTYCNEYAISNGSTIDSSQTFCTPANTSAYTAKAVIDNPTNEALTYKWQLIVTDASGNLGGTNPPVPGQDYVLNQSSDPVLNLHDIYPSYPVTSPCRVTLTLGAPDPSRSKTLTVWSGKCTYRTGVNTLK